MNCEKCRWYKRTYPVYTFGEFSARCLLGGCDESQYVLTEIDNAPTIIEAEEGE